MSKLKILVIPYTKFFLLMSENIFKKYGRQLTSKYFWICTLLFSITCLSVFCWNMNLKLSVGNSKLFKFEQSGRNFRCNPWNWTRLRETTQPELMPSSFTDSLSIICTTITKYSGSFSSGICQKHDIIIILLFWRFFFHIYVCTLNYGSPFAQIFAPHFCSSNMRFQLMFLALQPFDFLLENFENSGFWL